MAFTAAISAVCIFHSANFSALNYAIFQVLQVTLINETGCLIESVAEKLIFTPSLQQV